MQQFFQQFFYVWIWEFHQNLFRLKLQHTALICSQGLDNSLVIIVKSFMVVAINLTCKGLHEFTAIPKLHGGDLEIRWNFEN